MPSSHSMPSRSRWFVGSSRSRTSGATARACAMASRLRQPPESEAAAAAKSVKPARPRVSRISLSQSVVGTWAARTASSITDHTVCPATKSEICDT